MLTLPEKVVFALVLVGFIAYVVRRVVVLVRLIRMGKPDPENRKEHAVSGAAGMLLDVVSQRKVLRKPWAGMFHLLIVWGFFVFAINTINHFAGAFLPGFNMLGDGELAFRYGQSADLFAVLIVVGCLGLAVRRYVFRPSSLTPRSVESAIVLVCIAGAMCAYLLAHGALMSQGMLEHPAAYWASEFVAAWIAPLPESAQIALMHLFWWLDAIMHMILVALLVIPTKHQHLVAGPINLIFKRTRPRGQMLKMDLEDETAESFGVAAIDQFTWKQNLDLYACIECGRCQDFCPTAVTEKPLNPKLLITGLKHHLLDAGPRLLHAKASGGEVEGIPALIGEVVDKEAIWACTTCGACVEHCPMGIEHYDKITDMRRSLTLMEGDAPERANQTFKNLETAGNPWGLAPAERGKWAEGLDVPVMAEKRKVEVLFWVGCSGSYDDRSKKISAALVKVLRAAGVDFAILGSEERCHCESARRLGNEYLYQSAAAEIVETLKQYEFKRILTACPHCFNTFANEYPDFEGKYEVVHHSQFIAELIRAGRLRFGEKKGGPVAFHDSCYLGRYNGVYDAPRAALGAAGRKVTALARQREKGFCCGAGGGRMWLEERLGQPINQTRMKELLGANPSEIAAACPFCITMLTDAAKALGKMDTPVRDIAEMVAEALVEGEE